MDAKKKEKDFLESEYNALYIKYKKIEDEMKSYNSEVTRYSNIIKPAEERVSRYVTDTSSYLQRSHCQARRALL